MERGVTPIQSQCGGPSSSPDRGGTPYGLDGGTPIQFWWGGGFTPSSHGRGYPHPVLTGDRNPVPTGSYPIQSWQGGPPSSLNGRYSHPVLMGIPWMGYPCQEGWGYLPLGRMRYPHQWMVPQSGPGRGTHPLVSGRSTPGCELTDKLKILPSPILRMRAVTSQQ